MIDSSGTSKVVKAHQDVFLAQKINFVVIFPLGKTIPGTVPPAVWKSGCYGLVANGNYIGVVTIPDLLKALANLQGQEHSCRGILIHHLYRGRIEWTQQLVNCIPEVPVIFYLHDYYSFCKNPKLMKNDQSFCNGNIAECATCIYGKYRQKHVTQVSQLLETCAERLTCVAPAVYTKNIWEKLFPDYAKKTIVIPHLMSSVGYQPENLILSPEQPLRIAYVGAQTNEKGWKSWEALVRSFTQSDYRFFYFGNGEKQLDAVTNVCVEVARQGKNAMVDALRKYQIHTVILGSVCPETYSYTMYESHAANCYILTPQASGNIAFTVQLERYGGTYLNTQDLIKMFEDSITLKKRVMDWQHDGHLTPQEYQDNDEIVSCFPDMTYGKVMKIRDSIALKSCAYLLGKIYKK